MEELQGSGQWQRGSRPAQPLIDQPLEQERPVDMFRIGCGYAVFDQVAAGDEQFHPRWTFHFTPTSGSWLNAVESFFTEARNLPPCHPSTSISRRMNTGQVALEITMLCSPRKYDATCAKT